MPLYDLTVRNGTLVTPSATQRADIAVADGHIVEVAPEITGTAREEIDATGLHIFPGVIDAHVHFNEPGRADWEGFTTGTQALAAGGSTLYFDMPLNAHPPTIDAAAFDLKRQAGEAQSLVDFALWGGIVPGNLDHLEELAERGVAGFKAFMSNSGIEDFPACDDYTLYEGMAMAAKLDLPVLVHAENDAITGLQARRAVAEGRTTVRDYLRSRPPVAEHEAIQRAILFAGETGCSLHIVHVSSGRGVALVTEARLRGIDVTCETCPHYLVLTGEDMERLGAIAKCAPPMRSQAEQDLLWQFLSNGTLPMVASDHSPSPPSMKTGDDFFAVWGGVSGCQSLLQLLLTYGHARRDLPLTTITRVTSDYVAKRFGVWPAKGHIGVDADADLALVDLAHSAELQAEDLLYRHKQSPYVGMTLQGRIVRTLVRGATVWIDGKAMPGPVGKLVRPAKQQVMRANRSGLTSTPDVEGRGYVEFFVEDEVRFALLHRVFKVLKSDQEMGVVRDAAEWYTFFSQEALSRFWWPTQQDMVTYRNWKRSHGTEDDLESGPVASIDGRYSFPAMVEAFGRARLRLLNCRMISFDRARLEFSVPEYPLGEIEWLHALVTAFGLLTEEESDGKMHTVLDHF